jgi:hypothetical protein
MTGVSAIDAGWMAPVLLTAGTPPVLLHFGPPLSSPLPVYDATADAILSYCVPSYGTHHWELPPMKRPLAQFYLNKDHTANATAPIESSKTAMGYRRVDEPYRWFARLLLEGGLGLNVKGVPTKGMLKETAAMITQLKPNVKVCFFVRIVNIALVQYIL